MYRVPSDRNTTRQWKRASAAVTFAAAAGVAVRPPGFVVPDIADQLSLRDRLHSTRVTLLLQSQKIEALRTRESRMTGFTRGSRGPNSRRPL